MTVRKLLPGSRSESLLVHDDHLQIIPPPNRLQCFFATGQWEHCRDQRLQINLAASHQINRRLEAPYNLLISEQIVIRF